MKNIVAGVAMLTWSLWFGGVIALFIFVQKLFSTDREVAVLAAPQMFLVFARYQIGLAAVALVAVFVWRIASPSVWVTTLFFLFAAAFAAALFGGYYITPKMEILRAAGQVHEAAFKHLHGLSMIAYVMEAVSLLFGGYILALAIRK